MHLKYFKKITLISVFVSIFLFSILLGFHASIVNADDDNYGLDKAANEAGFDTSSSPDVYTISGQIIQYILSFVGVIFLILIIYGGFQWMTARGNEEQVTKAKNLMYNATIGVILILAAYTITYYVINTLIEGTQNVEETESSASYSSVEPKS